jgi:pSer/pThr/pTyr-binding forkhead associated (FHA) protein
VSSKHLELSWSGGSWFALDVGSSNGTKLNDSQVRMMTGEGGAVGRKGCPQPKQPSRAGSASPPAAAAAHTDQRYKLHDNDQLHLGPDTILQVQVQVCARERTRRLLSGFGLPREGV